MRKHEKQAHAEPDSKHMFKYNCTECDFVSDDKTEFQTHTDRHMNMKHYREVVCSPGHFLKGAVNLSLENQINWYYA